jgi:hypothetical protein
VRKHSREHKTRRPNAWFAILAVAAATAFSAGCVAVRGPVTGVVVDQTSDKAVSGIEVYHYVKQRTRWPWRKETTWKMAATHTRRTSGYGDFHIGRSVCWQIPFVQMIEEERVIVNLTLPGEELARTLDHAQYSGLWTDPLRVKLIDPRYLGAQIDLQEALYGQQDPFRAEPQPGANLPFYHVRTDSRDLARIPLIRNSESTAWEGLPTTPPPGNQPFSVPPIRDAQPVGSQAPMPFE